MFALLLRKVITGQLLKISQITTPRESMVRSRSVASSIKLQHSASVTVVLVTFTYLVYNIPVFMNNVLYTIVSYSNITFRKTYGTHPVLYWYSWPLTFVGLIAFNSVTNPIVYFTRMHGFKKYVGSLVGCKGLPGVFKGVGESSAGSTVYKNGSVGVRSVGSPNTNSRESGSHQVTDAESGESKNHGLDTIAEMNGANRNAANNDEFEARESDENCDLDDVNDVKKSNV